MLKDVTGKEDEVKSVTGSSWPSGQPVKWFTVAAEPTMTCSVLY